MKSILTIIISYLLINNTTVNAQKSVTQANQQWFQYYNQTKISEKWTVLADAGYRFRNTFKEQSQYIARVGVGYSPTPETRASIGIATSGVYDASGAVNRIEYRPHQEYLINAKLNSIKTQLRFRLEERFFKNTATNVTDFNLRFRQYFMASIPLLKLSSDNPEKKMFLNVGDEIFLNQGKEIIYNTFDQNRFLIGHEIQFSKDFSVTFIYNYQFQGLNAPTSYRSEDILWISIRHKLDVSKKEAKD